MMEPALYVSIPIEPVPKGRPRLGRGGRVFTPPKTRAYEQLLAYEMRRIWGRRDPLSCALRVNVVFQMTRAKSNKTRHPAQKPDLDNLIKGLDALNGIVWEDDSQIVELNSIKQWAAGKPCVIIRIDLLE